VVDGLVLQVEAPEAPQDRQGQGREGDASHLALLAKHRQGEVIRWPRQDGHCRVSDLLEAREEVGVLRQPLHSERVVADVAAGLVEDALVELREPPGGSASYCMSSVFDLMRRNRQAVTQRRAA
jgi:hypothetical protein